MKHLVNLKNYSIDKLKGMCDIQLRKSQTIRNRTRLMELVEWQLNNVEQGDKSIKTG